MRTQFGRVGAARACATVIALALPAMGANIIDIGTLAGGNSSAATAINASGQVAGYATTASGDTRPVRYSGGTLTDLGTLGGTFSYGYGINASGTVVGNSYTGTVYRAFSAPVGGSITSLGSVGTAGSYASAINDSGVAVGRSWNVTNTGIDPASYSGGSVTSLSTGGGFSGGAGGINANGDIVGGIESAGTNITDLFLYHNGVLSDLGNMGGGGTFSEAFGTAINNSGLIVGSGNLSEQGPDHAFYYSGGAFHDMGTLNGGYQSGASGVNSSGEIVGYSWLGNNGNNTAAFLYANGSMIDLNTLLPNNSGWQLATANGINDSGLIVGTGTINGQTHGYILDRGQASATPEPGSFALLGAGGLMAGYLRSRRRKV